MVDDIPGEDLLKQREEGIRTADRDRALVRLDEREIKQRMIEAFDKFLEKGFSVHLIGVRARAAIEYTLALYPDGVEKSIPSHALQAIADEYRLDYTISAYEHESWLIVLYPRW